MLITAFYHVRPEGHHEPRNEVESLNPKKQLEGLNREPSNSLTTSYPTRPLSPIYIRSRLRNTFSETPTEKKRRKVIQEIKKQMCLHSNKKVY